MNNHIEHFGGDTCCEFGNKEEVSSHCSLLAIVGKVQHRETE